MVRFAIMVLIGAYFLGGCAHRQAKAPAVEPAKPAVAAQVPAVKKTPEQPKGTVCVNGSDSRTVQLKPVGKDAANTTAKVCEVVYTKHAQSESVASSSVSTSYCEEVVKRIQSNLEEGGFKCQG